MSFFFKTKSVAKEKINHHFIFIEAPLSQVGPQALLWNEAVWWPKECALVFSREESSRDAALTVGIRYQIKGKKPFMTVGSAEITKLNPPHLIERKIKTSLFEGLETLKAEERSNGTRIDYELRYMLSEGLPRVLWKLFLRRVHDRQIQGILAALQKYVLAEQQAIQEKHLEEK